ncbi:hypothetical protein PV10_07534 [Exophiala mesophila]|uniref:Uncharacterized protein n=1 Tax=Exophiala mesophila TaxID=212818 RepID=A0A0D1Z851_EXOME|nr:uncharacterized protein PV10_07534 [Exophiala mesophila]KIV90204.1 hypothetical protein PV10_07534 [Exophiala mesophila]
MERSGESGISTGRARTTWAGDLWCHFGPGSVPVIGSGQGFGRSGDRMAKSSLQTGKYFQWPRIGSLVLVRRWKMEKPVILKPFQNSSGNERLEGEWDRTRETTK